VHDDPISTVRAIALQAQYEMLVDRLRHAIQYAEAARKMAADALELVEGGEAS
jgi:hypothetical protein